MSEYRHAWQDAMMKEHLVRQGYGHTCPEGCYGCYEEALEAMEQDFEDILRPEDYYLGAFEVVK